MSYNVMSCQFPGEQQPSADHPQSRVRDGGLHQVGVTCGVSRVTIVTQVSRGERGDGVQRPQLLRHHGQPGRSGHPARHRRAQPALQGLRHGARPLPVTW